MFKIKPKQKVVTNELRKEYARLLEMWETQWDTMSNDNVRRFLSLERIMENERKKLK